MKSSAICASSAPKPVPPPDETDEVIETFICALRQWSSVHCRTTCFGGDLEYPEQTRLDFVSLSGTSAQRSAFPSMLSRSSEYRMHAVVCAAQASVVSEPFKHFYEALEFQWLCLALQAEREAVGEKVIDARAARSEEHASTGASNTAPSVTSPRPETCAA